MSDTTENAIVAKIRKLLAIQTAAGATEAEAANAATLVQRLLQAHNLEMSEVEAKAGAGAIHEERRKTDIDMAAMYGYQRELMQTIAKNNFCMYFVEERKVPHERKSGQFRVAKRHVLLGRKANIVSSEIMYNYLIQTMDRLLPWQGMEKRGKNTLLWLAGCTDRLTMRLRDERRKQERESEQAKAEQKARASHPGAAPGENALVLSEVYSSEEDLNTDALRGLEPGSTARKRKEYDAWYAKWLAERRDNPPAVVEGAKPKPETEAQRRKRQEREARQEQKADERWRREYSKMQARVNDPAYQAGVKAGANISLNQQVNAERTKRIG